MPKYYHFDNRAGCVTIRKNRFTKTQIGVYNAEQSGLDDDESTRWFTVCEDHSNLVGHRTLTLALSHAAMPEWCEDCQKLMDEKS